MPQYLTYEIARDTHTQNSVFKDRFQTLMISQKHSTAK
jgi:hypothetical protein